MGVFKTVLLGLSIALLGAASAQANVVYHWRSTGPGQFVTATGGQMVVTDAAYAAGAIALYNDYDGKHTLPYDAKTGLFFNSPVVSVDYEVSGSGNEIGYGSGYTGGVSVAPESRYFADLDPALADAVTFNADGTLTGNLFLYDAEDEIEASGAGRHWAAYNFGSDLFASQMCGPPTCFAGTGYWQLDASSVADVPAPPAWGLFALAVLGALGFGAARRRSHAVGL